VRGRAAASWLILAALLALGIAASVDAFRDGSGAEPRRALSTAPTTGETSNGPQTTSASSGEGVAEAARAFAVHQLRELGATGVLTYSDAACRLHSLTLPDLEPQSAPSARSCRFHFTTADELSIGREVPSSRSGGLSARCLDGIVEVRDPNGTLYARHEGCAPAWKPDGTPTLVRSGEALQFAPCPGDRPGELPVRCARVLLSNAVLARELRRARWTGSGFRVVELAWLSDSRLAAVVRARRRDGVADLLAVFEGGRLLSTPLFAYERLSGVRVSPFGTFVAARIGDGGEGLAVIDGEGRPAPPLITLGHAIAWSPDERWTAVAGEREVFVFTTERDPGAIAILPLTASDLVWR
jgi:hypothetical protein